MKLVVFMPTRAVKDPLVVEGIDYLKRVRSPWSADHSFLNPKKAIDEDRAPLRIEAESNELWQKTTGFYRIALSDEGKRFSSPAFSSMLNKLSIEQPKIAFLIGGAFGLSKDVIKQCPMTLSLSDMTLPHRMAFLMLSEQIYRAYEIQRGSLYHK